MGLIGGALVGASFYLTANAVSSTSPGPAGVSAQENDVPEVGQKSRRLATLTPTPTKTATPENTPTPAPVVTAKHTATPTPQLAQKTRGIAEATATTESAPATATESSNQTTKTRPTETLTPTATPTEAIVDSTPAALVQAEAELDYVEPYTSTDQVQPPPSANSQPVCPVESAAAFDLIPIEGRPIADHPDFLHADLNLSLRGYKAITESLQLEFYNGNTDVNAPRLHGLFEPNRIPEIRRVYQINEWIWDAAECGGTTRGCRGGPIDVFWPVTLAGLMTTPGEIIYTPERGPQIHPGGYVALVLYAEERRITLGYTRRDSVGAGYTIHLESVCVDPNLLALYRAQRNADGWHTSGFLPALRNNQALGIASGNEIKVAIRDAGSFMDPRSHKDWWQ